MHCLLRNAGVPAQSRAAGVEAAEGVESPTA
jgi:hypothetical protein